MSRNKNQFITKLPTKAQVIKSCGYLDNDVYMGFSLQTGCTVCDGTGFVVNITEIKGEPKYLGVLANADVGEWVECCPFCNPNRVKPRNQCRRCDDHVPTMVVQGYLMRGSIMSWQKERMIACNMHMCEQCINSAESDGSKLRLIR